MPNKLFGNPDPPAPEITVKRRVEMFYIGCVAGGTLLGAVTFGLMSTIYAFFPPAPTAPSLADTVALSVVCLGVSAAFVWLTFWTHGKAKDLMALAEPSDVQQG